MYDDQDLYLESKRRLPRWWWIVALALGVLLCALAGLAIALTAGFSFASLAEGLPGGAGVEATPTATLVPTFTPRPPAMAAPSTVILAAQPWTNDRAPVGLVEVTLSVPAAAQVSHQPPPGFRYWRGDLLPTHGGLGWSAAGAGAARWYLFREPGADVQATLEVTVNGQRLAVDLQPATPVTVSALLEGSR